MKNLFGMLLLVSIVFCGCKKEETADACATFTTIGTATVDGSDENLVAAQLLVSQGSYAFQLAAITDDCLSQKSINITIEKATGSIAGTYAIKDFFDVNNNEASGSYISQKFNPVSQSLEELTSGTVIITEHGTKDYTIDISAKTALTPSVKFKARHKF